MKKLSIDAPYSHGHYLDHMEVLKISDINFTWSVNILTTLIYL